MGMVKVLLNGKYEIILPAHRAAREQWFTKEGWERERMDSIHDTVKTGDIMIYAGNEEGDLSGLISQWGCQMILIEPNSKVWSNSKAIWEANNLQMPLCCFVGFAANKSDFDEKDICLNSFPDCANSPIISDHGFKSLSDEGLTLPKIKIDDLVSQTGFIPKHIACDCEGSEFEIFMGAEQTLREYKPTLWISIHPEMMITQYNQWSFEFRKWIKDFGYSETLLAYQHELHTKYTPL